MTWNESQRSSSSLDLAESLSLQPWALFPFGMCRQTCQEITASLHQKTIITNVIIYINKRPVGLSSFVNCPPVVASFLTQRQLSINAGWQHMGRDPHPNYVYPECCVATVCHQVRFMYWEHLGHFQRAISHLKWHKIVCMRYLACAFSQMKSTDMFSMYLQSGVPRHFIWWFIAGWT